MLALRIPDELRERLERMAAREQRSVSKVATRAIELGLDAIERAGFSYGSARERGDAFEEAVLKILVAHGLLAALPDIEPESRPTKRLTAKKKAG